MSYCPRPSKRTSKSYPAAGTKKVTGGTAKEEPCAASGSSVVVENPGTPSESTSTTVYVPGPPGPTGATGEAGLNGLSFFFRGEWGTGASYSTANLTSTVNAERIYDVVTHHGQTYICTQTHTSDSTQEPQLPDFTGPTDWSSYWSVLAEKGSGALAPADKTFFDSLKDDIFDWYKNATLGEVLQAAAIATGVIWAGSKIIDSMSENGDGTEDADSRYTGSLGYVTSAFAAPTIKQVLQELCEYGGILYDVSAMPDSPCQATIGQNTSIRTVLAQLAVAYQFDMVDSAGTLKFVPRAVSVSKTLTDADIGFDKGSVIPARYNAARFQGIDLPRSVTLSYIADDTDYNTMTQVSQLPTFDEGQDVQLQVPITLTHEQAKQITEISLMQAHVERTQYKFTGTYDQLDIECGDVLGTPMGNIRVTRLGEKDEGLIEIEGTSAGVAEAVLASNVTPAIPPASTNIPVSLGYSQAFWLDSTALSESDTGVRMYAAVHGYNRAGWPGAAIYMSENGGASYTAVGTATKEATIGLVASAPASASHLVWDESTTISVTLKTGTLTSVSELDVLNGKNWAQIGQEVIGFRTATLTAPKTYTLSGLLRGRRGTEQFIGTHVSNELFVLIDDALVRLPLVSADQNTIKKFKVVTIGSSLDKVSAEDVQITSNNLRLWTPHSVKALHVGSDWQISFGERVRFKNKLQDGSEINHDSDWAGFGIVIYDTDGTTVKNKYLTTSETYTYTAAQQTTDFGSPQSALKFDVLQVSQLGAPGYPVRINT